MRRPSSGRSSGMASWPSPRARLLGRDRDGAREGGGDGRRREAAAAAAPGLTLDDLILRRGDGGASAGNGRSDAYALGRTLGGGAGAGDTRLFSKARAPVVVTGWQNPHAERGDGAREGGAGRNKPAVRAGARGASAAEERRTIRQPTDLAGARNAVGVVRDAVDYNAGYLSPDEVNADLDGPPSPVRGFAQRLMSLAVSPTPRGKHSRKRVTTNRSAEPDGAFAFERKMQRSHAGRSRVREADALAAAARRMPMSPASDSGAPESASRSGRTLRAPGAFWSNGNAHHEREQVHKKRGPGRPPKNAKCFSPPTSEDEYDDIGAEETWSDEEPHHRRDTNAARALDRIRKGTAAAPRQSKSKQQRTQDSRRKQKPGPKPGMAAAKKAAMIAAGIPIPVLPPGVKRGRGRPPKSMLVIPDGPVNANLPEYVLRKVADVDPSIIERVQPELGSEEKPKRHSSIKRPVSASVPYEEERTACVACGRVDGEDRMLLCDGCDRGYHTHCLVPRLERVPQNEWFCYECVTENRPKTAAAAAFERRQAEKARFAMSNVSDYQRVSDKLKLNGEPKLKPGPKPGSKSKRTRLDSYDDEEAFEDKRYYDDDDIERERRRSHDSKPSSMEKRPVGRPRKDPHAWSEEQLEALQNAQVNVELGRKNFWTEVASYVPGKTAKQCRDRVYGALGIDADEAPEIANVEHDDIENVRVARSDHLERTLTTPTKPNSARENAERWRHRSIAQS